MQNSVKILLVIIPLIQLSSCHSSPLNYQYVRQQSNTKGTKIGCVCVCVCVHVFVCNQQVSKAFTTEPVSKYLSHYLQILGVTLPYDNMKEVHERLDEVSPNLTRYGYVEEANYFKQGEELAKVSVMRK